MAEDDPALDVSTPSIYVDGTYHIRYPSWHGEHAAWKASQIARVLARHAVSPRTIGDVGCGTGDVLHELQSVHVPGAECWGFDLSPQARDLARRKATPLLHFTLGPPRLAGGEPFDLLLAIDVIEHVDDVFGFLRALRPLGRRLILHVPLDLSALAIVTKLPERVRRSAGHLHYFTKDTCLATVAECGYKVVDHVYTEGAVDAPTTSWRTRLARLPRRLVVAVRPDWAARLLGGYSLLVLADPECPDRRPRSTAHE
jgi:SAM-dependent methyltransferase